MVKNKTACKCLSLIMLDVVIRVKKCKHEIKRLKWRILL